MHPFNGVCRLHDLGVIRVAGEDAAGFLQGQLTQDVLSLGPDQARLAAFCNAKGRMQASFIACGLGEAGIALVVSRDLLERTLKRLSMFVLRAKVKLTDASADYALYGLTGDALDALDALDPLGAVHPGAVPPWTRTGHGQAGVVRLYPADGRPRALWLAPAGIPAPAGAPLAPALWQWSEVRSGVATLTAPIFEAFVPQMLNYESVGGVSFKKGCYPGQEVVARSQFRGTLKRRAYLAHAEGALAAGQEVFHEADEAQPCGLIVQAAAAPGGGWDAIVSMQVAAAAGRLNAGAAGPALVLEPLPYLLLADV